MANPKFEFKNLTRTDLLQYDGEKFINVPVYSVRDKVRWEKEEIEQANLRINNNIKTVSLVGHKHQISDIENLQNILNIVEGSDTNWSSLVNISTFNNHVNNLGPNKHLTQEQINMLFSGSGSGSGGSSFWTFVDTDENGNSLETPYIKTEYPVVSEKNITAYKNNTDELESLVLFSLGDAVDINLTGVAVDNLLKYNGTHWVNVPMSSLEVGTTSSWGTTSNNYSTLSVDNIEKTVALQGHTHNYLPLTGGTLTGNLTAPLFIGDLSGLATNLSRSILAGNGLTGGGQLTANRTLSLGTPSTLNNATTNSVGTSSHTHAITTTTVGSANTIVATDASGGIRGSIIRIGDNWTLELSGTELLFKYGGVTKQRMFQDGSFSATGEVSAYSQGTAADELQLNKLTLLQGGGLSKYLSSTATQVYFDIDRATPLSMTKTEVRRGTSDNNVSLGTSAYPWANIYGVNLIASTNLTTPKITLGNGWTIEQTSASLTIRRNGVVKGTFTA